MLGAVDSYVVTTEESAVGSLDGGTTKIQLDDKVETDTQSTTFYSTDAIGGGTADQLILQKVAGDGTTLTLTLTGSDGDTIPQEENDDKVNWSTPGVGVQNNWIDTDESLTMQVSSSDESFVGVVGISVGADDLDGETVNAQGKVTKESEFAEITIGNGTTEEIEGTLVDPDILQAGLSEADTVGLSEAELLALDKFTTFTYSVVDGDDYRIHPGTGIKAVT